MACSLGIERITVSIMVVFDNLGPKFGVSSRNLEQDIIKPNEVLPRFRVVENLLNLLLREFPPIGFLTCLVFFRHKKYPDEVRILLCLFAKVYKLFSRPDTLGL